MGCEAITKEGELCKNNSVEGLKFCHLHIRGFCSTISYYLSVILGVKPRFLFWCILFAVIIFLIQVDFDRKYNNFLDTLTYEPDVEIEISPFLQSAAFGEYLQMIVTNTGDYTFYDVHVSITTCGMNDNYDHYE